MDYLYYLVLGPARSDAVYFELKVRTTAGQMKLEHNGVCVRYRWTNTTMDCIFEKFFSIIKKHDEQAQITT